MEQLGEDLGTMRRVPLADEHVEAISEIGTERRYEAGDIIAEIGDPMDCFVYVLEGEIEVVDPETGGRLIESTLGPTQFMGELGFLNRGVHYLCMRAVCATRVIEAPREGVLDLMRRIPELSDHIITVFAARRRAQFEMSSAVVTLLGADRDPAVQAVERFMSRNRIPFASYDMEGEDSEVIEACELAGNKPAVILGTGEKLDDPTPRKVAQFLGLDLDICSQREFDLLIVGGGPAGVAAAVYAGSEGLEALVVEDMAVGGQAGTSSRIENYMGFPTGISGTDLTFRGQIQAMKFGTRFVMPRRVVALEQCTDGGFLARLDEDDDTIRARAVLVATGVQYRRLPLPRLRKLEGAGIYYAATEMEARFCARTDAVVIGGGNSAGQAAMFLSRSAARVHLVVREDSLGEYMSSYLSKRLEAADNITIHFQSEVSALHGDDWLEGVTLKGPEGESRLDTRAMFVMIGAAPNTGWLEGLVETDGQGFLVSGADAGQSSPFETGTAGIFAVGDVRAGSVKRVASAVGEGSVVVSAIWSYLDALDNPR
ncbi:FAD-dependent oxidoreductase [Qipengyuania nanhaisediminis]|uniref:FAD-dependent oxidoreductase n=1 Tax=Qipengyuania nanhaisediminis TaxID=604088 RepID=UPI0038B280CB